MGGEVQKNVNKEKGKGKGKGNGKGKKGCVDELLDLPTYVP